MDLLNGIFRFCAAILFLTFAGCGGSGDVTSRTERLHLSLSWEGHCWTSLCFAPWGNNWAVLVETSKYWYNYRHAANVAWQGEHLDGPLHVFNVNCFASDALLLPHGETPWNSRLSNYSHDGRGWGWGELMCLFCSFTLHGWWRITLKVKLDRMCLATVEIASRGQCSTKSHQLKHYLHWSLWEFEKLRHHKLNLYGTEVEAILLCTRTLYPRIELPKWDVPLWDLFEVDYRGDEVSVENFLRLLTGEKTIFRPKELLFLAAGRHPPSTPRSKRLLTDASSRAARCFQVLDNLILNFPVNFKYVDCIFLLWFSKSYLRIKFKNTYVVVFCSVAGISRQHLHFHHWPFRRRVYQVPGNLWRNGLRFSRVLILLMVLSFGHLLVETCPDPMCFNRFEVQFPGFMSFFRHVFCRIGKNSPPMTSQMHSNKCSSSRYLCHETPRFVATLASLRRRYKQIFWVSDTCQAATLQNQLGALWAGMMKSDEKYRHSH